MIMMKTMSMVMVVVMMMMMMSIMMMVIMFFCMMVVVMMMVMRQTLSISKLAVLVVAIEPHGQTNNVLLTYLRPALLPARGGSCRPVRHRH